MLIMGASMAPTLIDGTFVEYKPLSGEPKPGDIVAVADPTNPNKTLVKRVISLAGPLRLMNGRIIASGSLIQLSRVDGAWRETQPNGVAYSVLDPMDHGYDLITTVPPDHVWLMGDNRKDSRDSRHFGAIKISEIRGFVDVS